MKDIVVIKRNHTEEKYDGKKIIIALKKAKKRVNDKKYITDEILKRVVELVDDFVEKNANGSKKIFIDDIHFYVIISLERVGGLGELKRTYSDYIIAKRNCLYEKIHKDSLEYAEKILVSRDRSNSNMDTDLNSTKRTAVATNYQKELYKSTMLRKEENEAMVDGFIYTHDLSDLLIQQVNCLLLDFGRILKGGFVTKKMFYPEPDSIGQAITFMRVITILTSGQHFGGLTLPEVDKVLYPYLELSIEKQYEKLKKTLVNIYGDDSLLKSEEIEKKCREEAYKEAVNEMKKELKAYEAEFNTVGSSRGPEAFITWTFGDCDHPLAKKIVETIYEVRMEGHGVGEVKNTLIFPKLVYLWDEEKMSKLEKEKGSLLEDIVVRKTVECISKCMYPDILSSNGHKKEGKWISPMGCRAFLSDWRDENGELQFIGRANIGAISLNLCMIYMKAKEEGKDFFSLVEHYMQMIRGMHQRRYVYLGEAMASSSPMMFMEGGLVGGTLKSNDRLSLISNSWTASFGVTSLNELENLETGHGLAVGNDFSLKTMKFIDSLVKKFTKEDGHLYAIYGTPAESLCSKQIEQFRKKYGVIKNVSDKEFFSNSFHCHVCEELTPFEKQDKEEELFKMVTGGHIQYVRVSNTDNKEGILQLIKRGVKKGFYQGFNFNACTCANCGNSGSDWEGICPKCESNRVTVINRICGYMGYSQIATKDGFDHTLNTGKMCELKDRKSM